MYVVGGVLGGNIRCVCGQEVMDLGFVGFLVDYCGFDVQVGIGCLEVCDYFFYCGVWCWIGCVEENFQVVGQVVSKGFVCGGCQNGKCCCGCF